MVWHSVVWNCIEIMRLDVKFHLNAFVSPFQSVLRSVTSHACFRMTPGDSLNCSQYMQSHHATLMDPHAYQHAQTINTAEAMNKVEVCERQVEELRLKLNEISGAVEVSLRHVEELGGKRLRLNGLLENVFNGEYGSDLENRLDDFVNFCFSGLSLLVRLF